MKDFLAKYLKDWRVWTMTGAVFGVVVAASFVGRVAAYFFLGMAAAAALVLGAVRLVGRRLRTKSAHELERGMMGIPSPPIADGRGSIQELNRGFRQSLDKLRDAPELGSDYLYRVPWYLMIGEPASGKTTTIHHSKLDLIGDKQQGIGGTLNCDWFFTNHGIILDTAGRYVFADEGAPDRKEWEAFLGLLRKHRPRQPLNGVILVIPVVRTRDSIDVPLLLPGADSDEELLARCTRDAEKLYAKVSQLPQSLGIRFPVYILLTKCDKVPGFQEFFTQAPMEYQTQLLGWSNPEVEAAYTSNMVDRAFETVDRNLERARLEILARELPLAFPDEVFIFPEEFKRLREPLRRYTDVLFKRNIFQESLLFRGIYFSSGLQDRKPLQGLLGGGPAAGGEDGGGTKVGFVTPAPSPLFESKPYFIRDFYTERVFPESGLVRPTRARYQKAKRLTTVLRAATLAIGVGGLAAFSLYVATVLSSSGELTDAVRPLRENVSQGFDIIRIQDPASMAGYTRSAQGALDAANKFDYRFLRWLKIDLPTQAVRETSQRVLSNLVLRPLAARFWERFQNDVNETLKRADLIKPVRTVAEAELVAILKRWKGQVSDYEEVLAGEKLEADERLVRLWKLATGQDQPPSEVKLVFTRHKAQKELARRFSELPNARPYLDPRQGDIDKKIDELDQAVKLDVEYNIELLGEKALPVEILANEKATFVERRNALLKVVAEVDGLSPVLFGDPKAASPVEELFKMQFQKRIQEMDALRVGLVPLCKAPPRRGVLDALKDAVSDKLGKTAPADDGGALSSERWKKLETLLAGGKVRSRGFDAARQREVFIFHVDKASLKVIYTLSDEARDFLRQVKFIGNQKKLLEDPTTALPEAEQLDQEIEDALSDLLKEDFIADKRHLALVARVREILAGEEKFRSGETPSKPGESASTEGPLAPKSPSLVRIVQELVQRQVEGAIYQALKKDQPPPQTDPLLELGSDAESDFLQPLPKSPWISDKQRQSVERIQVQHAQNRLAAQRKAIEVAPIFQIEPVALRRWEFAAGPDTVNLQQLFNAGQTSHTAYFGTSVNQVQAQYAARIEKSRCLDLLKDRSPEEQKTDYGFWAGTRDESRRGTQDPEALKRRTRFQDLIDRITKLKARDAAPYGPLTRFLDEEAGVKAQVKPDTSFLDSRYLQVSGAVSQRIRQYMAVEFRKEFVEFAQSVYDQLARKFPISLDLATVGEPYSRMTETVVQKADSFFLKWGLTAGDKPTAAGDGQKKPLYSYIEGEFTDGSGVGLARAYVDLMSFVRANIFTEVYRVQVRILNLDMTFRGTLVEREREEVREANRVLSPQGFRIKVGDSAEQPIDSGRDTEVSWINPSPILLSARLPVGEQKYRLSHPDEKSPAGLTAAHEFLGDDKNQWALFRMLLQQNFRLDTTANILRFQFKIQPPLPGPAGTEIHQIPVYMALKFARASASESPAAAFHALDHTKLRRLYDAFGAPSLKLINDP